MPALDVPCQREIPEGKFEQTHLQDVQISTETRNLASLSEMMIAVFSFFTSHAFYSFSWDTISYFTTFPHCISTGNVNTFQDSTAAFFGREVTNICFLVSRPGRHCLGGEALSGGVTQTETALMVSPVPWGQAG